MKTILLADDDDDLRAELGWCLRIAGYAVLMARDGLQALDALRTEAISVLVLDLKMPGVSGLDVIGEMRTDPKLSRIPTVVLTGYAADAPRDLAALKKPVNPDQLLAVIRGILGDGVRKRTGPFPIKNYAQETPPPATDAEEPIASGPAPER